MPLQNPPRVLPTQVVPSAPPCESVSPPKPMPPSLKNRLAKLLPKGMELGDVLVLLIALLLLIESEEDMQTILITAAAFFLF